MNEVAKRFLEQAGDYQRQFTWMGCRIVQYPADIIALQEIVWNRGPEVIIETGVAYGGSILFYASMLEIVGRGEVIGIDVDLTKAVMTTALEKTKISYIEGSSIDSEIVNKVAECVRSKRVMVVLDSLHHEVHVAQELELWAPLVTKGQYLVVCDTALSDLRLNYLGYPLPQGQEALDNPKTAVEKFLQKHNEFKVDSSIEKRILVTAMPGGYLERVR